MKELSRKKIVLSLRWTVIIVTSYLILFGRGTISGLDFSRILILVYILSNLALLFAPRSWFSRQKFFYLLVIFDIGVVSFGMYLSGKVATDFYLVFFLIVILASISRNYKLLMILSGVISLVYGGLLYWRGLLGSDQGISYALRIPFIFIVAAFYGYIVQTFNKERQEQLALSEDKYRGLFENANDGIVILRLRDSRFQIADVNREAEGLMAYEKNDLLKKDDFDLFPPEDKEKVVAYFEEVEKTGEGRTDSLSLMRENGTRFEIDSSVKRVDMGEDAFFQMIFRDLTEQRKLEKKIRESKRHLESIFDSIRDRLSIQAPDYQILRVNRAVVEKYHMTFQEVIGKKCYEVYYQKPGPCIKCPVGVTIETKQPSSSIMKIPESESTLRIFSYPMLDDKANLTSIIEYTQDITEEQRLQEQLIRSEKLAGLGILTSGVTHEINNPLSGICGMAEFAMDEDDPLKVKEYLKDILNCGQKIREVIKGLSSFSRVAKREEDSLVDVHEVIENALRMILMTNKMNSVNVIKNYQPIEKIRADAGEIQAVFQQLVTNAFQAMTGREGRLTLATRSLNDRIEVKIGDNGVGIPRQYLNNIFDPFFTTRKFGEGKGLGLNIAYRIVTKYEGSIDVESKEDTGTTFTIQFPIRRDQ
jgi:PAS domain S-box-containing protein